MRMNRRGLLGLLGAGMASPAAAGAASAAVPVAFLHGVASGDPDTRSAVFWTRVTPADPTAGDVPVTLEVAADAGFAHIVRRAQGLRARASRDFTVKHDLDGQGLEPGTEYFYRFVAGEVVSPVGRVKTLPEGATTDVVLAVASCQLYPGGLFNAYEAMARLERLDAVVHLGDYIYEYGAEPGDYGMATGAALNRTPEPAHEIVSLDDYRRRHAQYKSDPDLQAAHARAAFICVWDDHEVTNDAWASGAQNHQPETEGDYSARKATALRAYYEWMPIRERPVREGINRSFHFGDLASLMMVETRLTGRSEQLDYAKDLSFTAGPNGRPVPDVAAFEAKRTEASRDLMAEAQRTWLRDELRASRSAGRPWQVLGNQVVMARVAGPNVAAQMTPEQVQGFLAALPEGVRAQVAMSVELFRLGLPFNLDAWDGYPTARERLYALFAEAEVQPIVLAGDSHAFWINELKDQSGTPRGVEFGTSSISSPSPGDFLGDALPLGPALTATNPEVRFCDQRSKGFTLLTLTPEAATAELIAVSTIMAKPFDVRTVKTGRVTRGVEGLELALEG
ncbi:alkaline phosphatase D family protein [Brevundimonas sp. VNH65]|uniref:alkaline phosphatase D family protein n=1 Tax=Brevundimonas sp. VNH65 TaxID=3400917 RepID=UPI003BFE6C07